MLSDQLLFKPSKSRSQSEFKSVRRLQNQIAHSQQANIEDVLKKKRNIFVPFVNQRKNGKLVANPLVSAAVSIMDKDYECSLQLSSRPSRHLFSGEIDSSLNKWIIHSVNSKQSKQTTKLIPLSDSKPMLSNAYSKSNLLLFKQIRSMEPPQSIPHQDQALVNSLYESYKKIKEFNINACRRRL